MTKRNLKIEHEGDQWRGATKAKIRLVGRWLQQAGFVPGSRVEVMCFAPGRIELRCSETVPANP